ncbi:MAG: hypothetical protein ACM3P1_03040 [Candidatus Saccharibacteria bacterium]
MNNLVNDPEMPNKFYERYTNYSDHQIKEILKNHKDYQESAVTAAIRIAIEREIIHSEQDLMASEYQSTISRKMTAFPQISNAYHYNKIIKSIFRVLFLVSLIPLIFGILKYVDGQLPMAFWGFGIGLFWLALTFALLKTHKMIIIFIQILFLIPLAVFLGNRIIHQLIFHVTDLLVLIVLTVLIIYFLLYLRKLFLTKPEEHPGQ